MPDRDGTLMKIAYVYEEMSTCDRNHVGAVISIDGRVIVSGYNGAPSGMKHCAHTCTCHRPGPRTLQDGRACAPNCQALAACRIAVHAEANAIAFAARHGLRIAGGTLHTTLSPCYACSQLIINAGLRRVVFDRPYRDPSGINLLDLTTINVQRYSA